VEINARRSLCLTKMDSVSPMGKFASRIDEEGEEGGRQESGQALGG
jgi:hypothetical protein